MRTNKKTDARKNRTHEGGRAYSNLTPVQQLRRSVMSCLLFEKEFYEDGASIADRISEYAKKVDPEKLAEIAIEARHEHHLRHVPLLLLTNLVKVAGGRTDGLVRSTIARVISRADEVSEFMALYWKDGKTPVAGQVKKGLAAAIRKFDAYQLAKYNRDYAVKLRDVMFLVHPKPTDEKMAATLEKLANKKLESPDTWEVALSGGADKKETFERLISENKLGALALLRNLRGMTEAGVSQDAIRTALKKANLNQVLPFRFVAAARACPHLEPYIDEALLRKLDSVEPLPGKTIVLVDVSGSMDAQLSRRSDMNRMDAAAALASMLVGDIRVFTFSDRVVEVPPRRGMAGVDAVLRSQSHMGTDLRRALDEVNRIKHDRLIVITDEQTHTSIKDPVADNSYMINVASARNGVGYGKWIHIDGFSESVIKYITEMERRFPQ